MCVQTNMKLSLPPTSIPYHFRYVITRKWKGRKKSKRHRVFSHSYHCKASLSILWEACSTIWGAPSKKKCIGAKNSMQSSNLSCTPNYAFETTKCTTPHVVLFLGPWQIPGSMYVSRVANLKHGQVQCMWTWFLLMLL